MRRMIYNRKKGIAACTLLALCMAAAPAQLLRAGELGGYEDDIWIGDTDVYPEPFAEDDAAYAADSGEVQPGGDDVVWTEDEGAMQAEDGGAFQIEDGEAFQTDGSEAAAMTGTYTAPDGWSEDTDQSTQERTVYMIDGKVGEEGSSTISCSYMDTNYSVLEYEQLRDMLTNNLLYSNVNAQISTSAADTKARDYLYILIVDDSAEDYRDIYHYVVGDYRCFCVEVREYRAEAEQMAAAGQQTPQQAGQSVAEDFVWTAM